MDCSQAYEGFALGFNVGFKTLLLIAVVAFIFGHLLPKFIDWLDRRTHKPLSVAQLQHIKSNLNARFDKRIAKAKQREGL